MSRVEILVSIVIGLVLVQLLGLAWIHRRQARRQQRLMERLDSLDQGMTAGFRDQFGRQRASSGHWPRFRSDSPRAELKTLIRVPDLNQTRAEADLQHAAADLAERFAPIWELAHAGASVEHIATVTGQSVGEVEVILNFHRQARRAATGQDQPSQGT